MEPKYEIYLTDGKGIINDKLALILELTDSYGSISETARTLHLSYRNAWGAIRDAEKHLGFRLLDKWSGGSAGGGARLTKSGRELLIRYTAFRCDIENMVHATYLKHFSGAVNSIQ